MTHEAVFARLESGVRSYCRETPNLFSVARGAEVWDSSGTRFIDFLSACGPLNYGHNHPELKQAAIEYLQSDGIGNALDFHTEPKLNFLSRFEEVILRPRGLPYVMQFTGPTGTNCVEAALKLARKFTGRKAVAAFTNAFHGMSPGALAVSGSMPARRAAGLVSEGTIRIPYDGYAGAGIEDLERFRAMALDPSGGLEPLAAVIVETVQGEGGLNLASAAWLRKLRDVCNDLGALLIVDDIQAGCGRTGEFFSFERADIVPDLVCLSKSLSGYGTPMAMLLIDRRFDIWQPAEHNGTFRGNSLAFVTGARALDFWEKPEFRRQVALRSEILDRWAKTIEVSFQGPVLCRKGLGMMVGIEFASPEIAGAAARATRRSGVLIERCGPSDEVLKLLPPINIDRALLDEGLARVTSAIAEAAEAARCSR